MTRKRNATIAEVAAAAGVSVTTVSHVLNDKGRVSKETKARVRAVARRMGYPSTAIPRVLVLTASVASETHEDLTNSDFFVQLVGSASTAAIRHGYAIALTPHIGHNWADARVEGAIVVDPVRGDSTLAAYRARGIPTVTIGRDLDCPEEGYWLSTDDAAGTRDLLRHLAASGSMYPAVICSRLIQGYVIDVVGEYERWCRERALTLRVVTAAEVHTVSAGYDAAVQLINSSEPPDAIFATTEWLALGAQLAAQHQGLSVPRDIRIASYGDGPKCRVAEPPITAINIHPDLTGARAVEMLVEVLNGTPPRSKSELMATRLMVRGSTRAVGAASASVG